MRHPFEHETLVPRLVAVGALSMEALENCHDERERNNMVHAARRRSSLAFELAVERMRWTAATGGHKPFEAKPTPKADPELVAWAKSTMV